MLSRLAKLPIEIPSEVEVVLNGSNVKVKGILGEIEFTFDNAVEIIKQDNIIILKTNQDTKFAKALSGTIHAIISNMISGVSKGFEKKLTILGVGYRAAVQGDILNLSLGYSHPVVYKAPDGITIKTPTPTEILITGYNKQMVGEVAAKVRGFREVEPYKGKGIRYANETVILKETKKK